MRARTFLLGVTALLSAACGDDPVAINEPAAVAITSVVERVGYGLADTLSAQVFGDDEKVMVAATISWSSSDPSIATISTAGVVSGVWPGVATIKARSGSAVDSVRIIVDTRFLSRPDSCHLAWIAFENHAFKFASVHPGWLSNQDVFGATFTARGTPLLYGAGMIFGTNAGNMMVSPNSVGYGRDFYNDNSCRVPATQGMHTVSLLQATAPDAPANAIAGLTVVQDFYAFEDAANDDYALLRLTFKNDGTQPISGIRYGMLTDFDIVSPSANVGSFTNATKIASAISADSVSKPIVGGIMLIGGDVTTYRTSFPHAAAAVTRSDYFGYLADGFAGSPTAVQDVKQLLAGSPINLQPGESTVRWFALGTGENRVAFNANMQAADAKARSIGDRAR